VIPRSLDIDSLERAYRVGALTPTDVISEIYERIARRGNDSVWIFLPPLRDALDRAAALEERRRSGERLPLFGIPFAVKDNIDVAGLATTAACPAFGYEAKESATAVRLLTEAGAILVGKTNLDQFAAGLVGVRSPHGACSSVFDARYIAGGSSSGSAVAVAAALSSFALGTDTAGSGRIPAAFGNIVGWKPTRGLVSTRGIVPACRSLDCVSVFALSCADVQRVARVLAVPVGHEPFTRTVTMPVRTFPTAFRFGVPRPSQRAFFGDTSSEHLFQRAIDRLTSLGGTAVEIDFEPFRRAGDLLYSGPWVAERLHAIGTFFSSNLDAIHPVTARIIGEGFQYSAMDAFAGIQSLESLKCESQAQWDRMDCLVVPTAGTTYTIEAVIAHPVVLNSNLGYYTDFANLLDLSGVAVPAGFSRNRLPFGITLLGPAFADDALLRLAGRFHRANGGNVGATDTLIDSLSEPEPPARDPEVEIAVVGAHLLGQPLNRELTSRGATLRRKLRTAPDYRLYALAGTVPAKPGLVRMPGSSGAGIEVEVWALSQSEFGDFVLGIPPPLSIGTLELMDKSRVRGFLCETFALDGARDITSFGGWRAYLGSVEG
jgi:allophanate hydrolase